MNSKNVKSLLSLRFGVLILLRGLSGILQFSGVMFISKYLGLESVGIFAIFLTWVSISTQVAGLGVNSYVIRILPLKSRAAKAVVLGQHIALVSTSIFITCASLLAVAQLGLLSADIYFLVILTVAVGTLNAVFENFHNASERQLLAATNFFTRALWPLFLLGYALSGASLETADLLWMIFTFELLAFFVSGVPIAGQIYRSRRSIKLRARFVKKALSIGGLVNFGSVLFLFAIFSPRIFLDHFYGEVEVGLYQLYYSILMFIPLVIEAAYFALRFPVMVREINTENLTSSLWIEIIVVSSLVISVSGFVYLAFPIISYLSDLSASSFDGEKFVIMAISALFYSLLRVVHYRVYALGQDILSIKVYGIGFSVSVLSSWGFISLFGLPGAYWSTAVAFASIFLGFLYQIVLTSFGNPPTEVRD